MDSDESIDDWESVSVDREQWTLLMRQLEDLLAVQTLLNLRDATKDPITLSVKKVSRGDTNFILNHCLNGLGLFEVRILT